MNLEGFWGSVEEVKPATTSEKRESIKSEVRAFASVHEIISEVKASVRELESNVKFNYIDPENCKELVRHLAGIGRDTITYAEGENKVMVISRPYYVTLRISLSKDR